MKIINAKIYTMNGPVIENGFVEFNDKILSIGEMSEIKIAPQSTDLDLEGAMVFPGFIDAHTHLGMLEDSLGFEGDDVNEMTSPCTPDLRAIDAVNSLDICFEEALKAGVTTVVTGPGSANPIAGTSLALKTYGVRVDDMVVKNPVAMKFALGENPKTVYNDRKQAPNTRMATAALIREQLTLARDYLEKRKKGEDVGKDVKMEALAKLFDEKLPAHFHAHRADDIFTAMRISEEFGLKYAIIHCTQGHQIADALSARGIEAMSGPFFTDRSKPELKSSTPANPGILSAKGVKTAIITDHPVIPIQYLALCAGLAVREGMDYYEALKAITINPAQICGIDDKVGSLEVGKDADLLVFDTNPLTLQAKPLKVFIDGKLVQ
ncbi:MAG TPA: amidohydrolase [Oscillospiraceae bacterium]|nr:amidohydrolase [Oscillospiraceae bacterium]